MSKKKNYVVWYKYGYNGEPYYIAELGDTKFIDNTVRLFTQKQASSYARERNKNKSDHSSMGWGYEEVPDNKLKEIKKL